MTTPYRDLPTFTDTDDFTPTDDARTSKERIVAAIRSAAATTFSASVADAHGESRYADLRPKAAHVAVDPASLPAMSCTLRHAADGSPPGTRAFIPPPRPASAG